MNVLADAASIASESHASCNDDIPVDVEHEQQETALITKKKGGKLQHILMGLLNDKTEPEAIWWLPGEKEFAIDAEKFPSRVLEVYFPGSKYASFIRRLHKLGFSRETRTLKKIYGALPEHAVAFRHEKFRRDRPELLEELKNGYWKEAKRKQAEKAREEAMKAAATSPICPPTIVETGAALPLAGLSSLTPAVASGLLEAASIKERQSPATSDAGLLLCLQNLRQQREEQDRQLELLLLQQREKQQMELAQQLALRHQLLGGAQLSPESPLSLLSSLQNGVSTNTHNGSFQDSLLPLQVLQHLQQGNTGMGFC